LSITRSFVIFTDYFV